METKIQVNGGMCEEILQCGYSPLDMYSALADLSYAMGYRVDDDQDVINDLLNDHGGVPARIEEIANAIGLVEAHPKYYDFVLSFKFVAARNYVNGWTTEFDLSVFVN